MEPFYITTTCINKWNAGWERGKQWKLSYEESFIFAFNRGLFSDVLLFMPMAKAFY